MALLATIKNWFRGANHLRNRALSVETVAGGVEYRLATLEDIPTFLAIERNVYQGESPWTYSHFAREITGSPLSFFLVAVKNSVIIGFIGVRASLRLTDFHISNFAVLLDEQKQGVGSKLMQQIEKLARESGGKVLSLETPRANQDAQGFYRKFGFETKEILTGYYETGVDAVTMEKQLTKND